MLNYLISKFIGAVPKPIVKKISSRYIAGARVEDAVNTIRKLNAGNVMATVDVLGEFIDRKEQAIASKSFDLQVLNTLNSNELDSNLSVKLTSLGLKLDFDFCCANVKEILAHATSLNTFV